ncbi:MAG: Gfo/Idh/MocA family oxidoreductase [Bacteriovoracaceae bacterium]|nr:Gfo/Idh/MocA family oxidoreductase [Bacteriovoracaceae bacterium]
MENIRVAIIGYGFLGKWHAEKASNLKNVELVAIVDSFEQSQIKATKKFPHVKIASVIKDVINDIDAAIVVTPTSTHFELVKYLLENNKHVFCEKPLTSTLKDSETIQKLLENKDIVLQVGHSERFHEVWENEELYASFLTAPCSVKTSRYAPFKGRATDVDVVQDLMIHDLDLIMMLLKEKPTKITSIGFKSLTKNWDHVESLLQFHNGNQANIIVGRNSVEEVRVIEITNNNGTICIDLLNNETSRTINEDDKISINTGQYNKRDHLYLEQEEFYNAIKNSTQPRVNCEAGVVAVKLVNDVLESLETGN